MAEREGFTEAQLEKLNPSGYYRNKVQENMEKAVSLMSQVDPSVAKSFQGEVEQFGKQSKWMDLCTKQGIEFAIVGMSLLSESFDYANQFRTHEFKEKKPELNDELRLALLEAKRALFWEAGRALTTSCDIKKK